MIHPALVLFLISLGVTALHGRELHVGPEHPFASIKSAIEAAEPGDVLHVHGGRYAEENLVVTKPLQLIGVDRPVLDGELKREVLRIGAAGVVVRGFAIRNGGRSSTSDLAGIRVESANDVTLEDNTVSNCSFAIVLARANHCRVQRNVIEGTPDVEQNSGNGIHMWNCANTHVQGNTVRGHRDGIYLEFASQSKVEENIVEGNSRYGLHFMFSHNSTYRSNLFDRNGAGVAVMYSREVSMLGNTFAHSWGASAYGLLLKDITDSRVQGNVFHHNSTAIYAQGASRVKFERNVLRENGWALRILASGGDNTIEGNSFIGNSFDVGTNGPLSEHRFAGNYWDRYEGYDLNRDGVGDVPFRPVGLFPTIVERVPASIVLIRSVMAHLLDRAEKAFPTLTPDNVVDAHPAVRAPVH